jgi:hypothetical protein
MASQFIFISHTTTDDEFARELREALEAQGLRVWTDSRNLRGGMKLNPEIERAIEQARQVLVVLSPETQNSPWVRKEIRKAEAVEKVRRKEGYCVVPILLPGVQPSALGLYFEDEPMAVPVQAGLGGVSVSMPRILAALGERLPTAD